ncbi:MAG: DNA translocase FtsK, partial [Desulfobacterales bacterium]
VTPGPVITTFEYQPAPGVKINKIVNLSDDLSLALSASSIRIVAPIPGKAVIGIEIPNTDRETVRFKELIASSAFEKSKSKLTLVLGKDIEGSPVIAELDKMPHLLIAGATGTGKSVALNTMICSILYKSNPEEVRFIMIDPKRIELSNYDGIPHLITPVVTDIKKATNALFWAVREMESRYELLSRKQAKNILQYNRKIEKEKPSDNADEPVLEPLPYVVIVIDELADLMIASSRDVELALQRLAQMARAAGIHLILATQRPSVDVLTGIIKANFPARLTFQVSSKTDSRTIIDTIGAENLLGNGDMLLLPPGAAKLQRIHGAYISEVELMRIVDFLKEQRPPEYDAEVTQAPVEEKDSGEPQEHDERYDDAIALVTRTRQASISQIQRHLRIGYNRAARIVEMMETEGVVGPSDGVKPREVLVGSYDDIP